MNHQNENLQDAIVDSIYKDFGKGARYALLKAGQRGGKGVVAAKLINKGFKHVAIISATLDQAKVYITELVGGDSGITFVSGRPNKEWSKLDNSLIILDEAMWISNSYDLFVSLLLDFPIARVLVTSSRGPSYDEDIRWQVLSGYSATAWDLNPRLNQADLISTLCHANPSRFIRDYCAY